MRTLVVGDVHGCAEELGRLVRLAAPDELVLVGDLYTKGPDPAGVWSLIARHGGRAVRGNHDQRLLDAIAGDRLHDHSAHETISELDEAGPAWRAHLASTPLFLELDGWTVVHAGVHPAGGLEATTPAMAMAMRRWPEGERGARPWWQQYSGGRRLIFGHDARRGLVLHPLQDPRVIGLDTGCVYGGVLTGIVLEERRLLQVPASRIYQAIGGVART